MWLFVVVKSLILAAKSAIKQVFEDGIGYSKKCFIFEAVEMEAAWEAV
jgi:hypothetical protein